jgi:uncharacterized protein involved in outer membrane biogenesis
MKTGKLGRILLWIVGSFVGLVILASIVVSFLDWNQYRGTLADLVSSRLGMRVELAGDIRLGILPRPSMSAESVRLLPAQEGTVEPVATAELIDVSLGLGALVKGELEVQHLGLKGIAVTLEERPDGSINLRGWPESEESSDEASAPIQMDRLTLENSTVTIMFVDGTSRKLDGINLELSGTLPSGPLEWEGSLSSGGERLSTTGKLRPASDSEAMSVKAGVGLSGGSADISGRLEDGGFTGRVQLKGTEIDRFAAAAQTLATGSAAVLPLPKLPFALDVQVDRAAAVTKVTSRTLSLGETHGRVDLVLTPRDDKTHIGGTVSIGIVDTKPWMDSFASTAEAVPASAAVEVEDGFELPVLGSVDVAIEGVQVNGGLIQQVDFSLGVNGGELYFGDLQALLPGATNLIFAGRVGASKQGKGKLTINSGNLPDLLRWAGYDPAGQVPAGRLATADLAADISLGKRGWAVSNIVTRLDTTNISGEVQGDFAELWPASVHLVADSINLDAYLPDSKNEEPLLLPETTLLDSFPARATRVSLEAKSMQWSGQSFTNAKADASLSKAAIEVISFDMKHRGGALTAKGRVKPVSNQWELDTDIAVSAWPFPFVKAVVPEADGYLRAAALNGLDATVRAQGPLSKLYVTASAEKGDGKKFTANGTVSYAADKPLAFDMRGMVKHNNLAPLAAMTGFEVRGAAPADLNYTITQAARGALTMDASGSFAGGQLTAKGQQGDAKSTWKLGYDHNTAKRAATQFLPMLKMPAPNAPLRIAAEVTLADAAWTVESLDIRNGDAQLAGKVGADSKQRLFGNLRGAGFVVENLTGNAPKDKTPEPVAAEPFTFESLRGYSGQVDLELDGVTLAGQRLMAPRAALTAGDGLIRMDLGQAAKLNGSPVTVAIDLMLDGTPKMKGKINIQDFDIAAALLSEGFGKIANGTASFVLDFQAGGETPEAMIAGLRGQGQIAGNAGGALNFLSVPALVRQMSDAKTPTAFLTSICGFLRQGTTNFAKLETKFTLDSGVALVESFLASGPWGALNLDGQVNFAQSLLDLKGQLDLTNPQDAPAIPVKYSGALNNPSANWTSRALESFVLSGIERRLRTALFKEQESQEATTGEATENPAGAVLGRAFGFLNKLKEQQEEEKRKQEEARKKAEEEAKKDQ